jgi:hypothetical protein
MQLHLLLVVLVVAVKIMQEELEHLDKVMQVALLLEVQVLAEVVLVL